MPLASLFTETMLYSEPDELRATVTEQQVQAFITKLYALFTGNLLLVNLFTLLFVIQPGLVSWLLTSGRVFRFGITLIAFISAVVVYTKQYERKSRNQIAILFCIAQAHELGLLVVLDRTEILQRISIALYFILGGLTVLSYHKPQYVLRIHHYFLASPASFPLLLLLVTLMNFECVQIGIAVFVFCVVALALLTYYTHIVAEKYENVEFWIAAVELYCNVVLRLIIILLSIFLAVLRLG